MNGFRVKKIFLSTLFPFGIVILWETLFRLGFLTGDTLSAPSLILFEFVKLIRSGELIVNAWHSLYLILLAFSLSCVIAIPLGVVMGANKFFHIILDPIVEMVRPIPPLALLPLAIVWFGIGISEKLFILIIGTFPPILINTLHGIKSAEPVLIKAARSMGATGKDILWKILIPSALPDIFIGMRIAMGFAFTVIVAAELVATRNGLGYLLTIGWRTYQLEVIFVSIITIALLAYVLELILRRLKRIIVKWQVEETDSQ
jgi:ABC-type nitrate/sulfonate/bicarbonate transport system permease component